MDGSHGEVGTPLLVRDRKHEELSQHAGRRGRENQVEIFAIREVHQGRGRY